MTVGIAIAVLLTVDLILFYYFKFCSVVSLWHTRFYVRVSRIEIVS